MRWLDDSRWLSRSNGSPLGCCFLVKAGDDGSSIHFLSTIVTAAFSVRDVGWVKFAWVRTDSREDVALGIT